MSASNPSVSNVQKIFSKLSYEPVVESDSTVKAWVKSHNNGTLGPFINGEYQAATSQLFDVKNPYNGDLLAKVANCDDSVLNSALEAALNAQPSWSLMSYTDRGKLIYNLARNVQKNLQLLIACESLNSGRTSREVKDLDIATVIRTLYYYAGGVASSMSESHDPVGVVAIVGHFDSPLLSIVSKLAAALVTGNTCLLVPSFLTPLSTYLLVDLCLQSGFPSGVVNLVTSNNEELLKMISRDPRVDVISFDGRLNNGQDLIISQAFVHPSKRTLLSVDGKSSMVIYESADIDSAVECVVDGCFYSNGQHRYSLNKLFIQECIYDDVVQRLEARFNKLKAGNHLDKCNDYGPVFNVAELREALENQSNEFGAEVKHFTSALQDGSNSTQVAPTLVKNVPLNSKLNLNEVNGPYLMLIQFRTVKESVELVNNSRFGSAVSIHSQNISLVMEVATLLNVGTVWVNSFAVERGVQVRKFSGNYKLSGVQSLENFLRPKFERPLQRTALDVEEVKKKFKTLGSLTASVPSSENMILNKTYKLYVGGKQARPDTQSSRPVYLPNGKLYCQVADASRKDVRNAVEAACSAYNGWTKRANHNKSQILYFFAENFNTRRSEFVEKLELLTNKSKEECEKEFQLCHDAIFYFASVCDKSVGRLNDSTEYGYLMEIKESLGCVAIVCDSKSKYPLLSFVLHMTGAIAHGNTVVIIPDETCPVLALDLYEVLETSDMPDGVCNILTGGRYHLSKYIVEHQQVSAVWYLNETNELQGDELAMQQFIRFTSSHSLKNAWLVNIRLPVIQNCLAVDKAYLYEIQKHSNQFKYVHIPMGVIFAN